MKTESTTPIPERAIELAREIHRLEAILKAMKDELKELVKTHGPVTVDGKTWDFYPAVEWRFSPEGLRAFAEELALDGIDPWTVLDVSSTALKKLSLDESFLGRFAERKETFRFYAKSNQ